MKKIGLLFAAVISLIFTVSCVSKEVPVTETYYETEYKTEYKTETYTATEDVVVRTSEGETSLTPISKWHAGIYFATSGGAGTYYYGYRVDTSEHTRSQIKIALSSLPTAYGINIRVCNLTGVGQIPNMPTTLALWREADPKTGELSMTSKERTWLDNLNAVLTNPERILGSESGGEISFDAKGIGEFAILANTFSTSAISNVKLVWSNDITEQKTVTKERQVPYEVPVQVEKQRTVMQTKKVPFWGVIFH